jgi:PAS domain S-box-containing protein
MRTSALKKVAAGLVLALPVLLVLDFLQYQSIHIVAITHQRVVHIHESLREIDAVQSQLKDAEAAVREYIAGGESVALNPFETSVAGVHDALGRLAQMVAEEPGQKARVQKIEPLVTRRLELLQQAVDLRGQKGFSIEKTRALDAQGRKLGEEIQSLVGDMEKEEWDLLQRRNAEARGSVQRATFITPFTAVLGLWLVALAALLLYRDVSERQWKGLERRMHARLLETLPVSVCLVDEGGLIFYTNPAQDALFGYESGDLIGRHASILRNAPRDEGDRAFAEIIEQLTLHGSWNGEFVCSKKDGTTFPCLVRASNMDLPGKVYRAFALQDLSDRPRT